MTRGSYFLQFVSFFLAIKVNEIKFFRVHHVIKSVFGSNSDQSQKGKKERSAHNRLEDSKTEHAVAIMKWIVFFVCFFV